MSERIKLPAQEWLGYDPEKGDIHGYTFDQMRDFAESIVQECCDIVESCSHSDCYSGHEFSFAKESIKKHFGVIEFEQMVEKGTKAWADTPDDWVDELRGGEEKS